MKEEREERLNRICEGKKYTEKLVNEYFENPENKSEELKNLLKVLEILENNKKRELILNAMGRIIYLRESSGKQ